MFAHCVVVASPHIYNVDSTFNLSTIRAPNPLPVISNYHPNCVCQIRKQLSSNKTRPQHEICYNSSRWPPAAYQSVGSLCTLCTNTFSILTNTFVQNTVFWADCKRSQRRPKVYQRNWWQNLVLCVWSRRKLCITLNCERPTDDGCWAPGCGGTLRSPHRWKLGASQKIRLARFWRKTGRAQKFVASPSAIYPGGLWTTRTM